MKHEKSQYTRLTYLKKERTATTTSTNLLQFDIHTILVVILRNTRIYSKAPKTNYISFTSASVRLTHLSPISSTAVNELVFAV